MNPARRPIAVEGQHLVTDVEPEWQALGRYGRANLLTACAQAAGWAALLTAINAERLPLLVRALAVLAFCLMMQGVFTLLHEFCHRNAHHASRLNYLIGWLTATLFGTAPTFLRVQHWGHHRRNRTAAERAEFIHEGESAGSKTLQYYAAILGGIWLGCFLVPLLIPFLPYRAAARLARNDRFNTFAAAFSEFSPRDWRRLRIEGLGSLAFWTAMISLGPWQLSTLVVAYGAFAFSWSSLQWIYHMHTPVHVVEGAYNLRAPLPVRALFLNFNYNLTHHRNPWMPWQELHAKSDPKETQPIWYRYLLVFRPPTPFPDDPAVLEKRYF
jgi:fatty acid desaturase